MPGILNCQIWGQIENHVVDFYIFLNGQLSGQGDQISAVCVETCILLCLSVKAKAFDHQTNPRGGRKDPGLPSVGDFKEHSQKQAALRKKRVTFYLFQHGDSSI